MKIVETSVTMSLFCLSGFSAGPGCIRCSCYLSKNRSQSAPGCRRPLPPELLLVVPHNPFPLKSNRGRRGALQENHRNVFFLLLGGSRISTVTLEGSCSCMAFAPALADAPARAVAPALALVLAPAPALVVPLAAALALAPAPNLTLAPVLAFLVSPALAPEPHRQQIRV